MKDSVIHFRAEFKIKDGKLKEYKKLVCNMSKVVEANEPGTLSYRFYFDTDDAKCVVDEIYTNSSCIHSQ